MLYGRACYVCECEAGEEKKPEKEKGLCELEQLIIVTVKSRKLPAQWNNLNASLYDNALLFKIY